MSAPDTYQGRPLRYKRFGGGYRRDDVEFALAELRLTLRQLDNDLQSLRDRNRDLESELHTARHEIENFRGREHELSQTMASVLRRAAEIEEGASARAREIVANAEESASQIRAEASRRIEDSNAQCNELLRLKDNLLDAMRSVVGDFGQAISRVELGERLFPGPTQAAPGEGASQPFEPTEAAPVPVFVPPPVPVPEPQSQTPPVSGTPDAVSIHATPTPPPPGESAPVPASPDQAVFDTRVELDAGPFSDFAALSAFERALAHMPKVEDVYVRRLAEDRALIELTLAEPAPLLETMRASLPYSLDVRSADRTKIVVNVAVQQPAGAR
jgi:F0F1-type ATP synthase membrane subunit b/b'